jgi:hypothetical protein
MLAHRERRASYSCDDTFGDDSKFRLKTNTLGDILRKYLGKLVPVNKY